MLALHHRKQPPYLFWTALLTVLTLIATLFPALPASASYAASDKFTLSKTVLSVGYATAKIQVTGTDMFPFKSDTKVSIFDQTGNTMRVIDEVQVTDSKHMSFTINPGLREGRYTLMIQSYDVSTTDINVMTTYDPTGVVITPGVDRDFRIDWTDPTDLLGSDIVIQYGPINQQYFTAEPIRVRRGVQTATIKLSKADFDRNKAYKFQVYSDNLQGKRLDFTNGGRGYTAVDTTPPGDIKDIRVTTVSNGFRVDWTNPADEDLDLVTVQYAEHGTTNWSDGFVVQAPTASTVLQPLNLAKRYDLRFIKTDKYANWAYQIDNHNGYGYTFDTRPPIDVSSLNVNVQSETSAYITWYDPQTSNNAGTSDPDDDFHHVNIYLKSPLTDWKLAGRVNKGVQAYTLTGLAPFIDYTVRVTSVDNRGNETLPGRISTTFKVGSNSSTDLNNLTTVTIQQEVEGGLAMKWTSENLSTVDFSKFKMYYAPANKPDLKPEDWKETVTSNRGVKTASLRDIPRGLYFLQMRAYDSHGIEQELRTYRGVDGRTDGFYVSGANSGLPSDVSSVRIQPNNGREMVLTWNAAASTGTHVSIYYAERSTSPNWRFVTKVDKRDQRYVVTGLNQSTDYFFKLVAVNSTTNVESAGVIYDNSGYGYNLLNGDTHPPSEVRNASASLSLNTLNISYEEPSDPDFDIVKIYAQKVGSNEQPSVTTSQRGSNGAALRELLPGAAYTLRLTTMDIYGNESSGVSLTNNGQGYAISGGGQAIDEVRNPLLIPDSNKLTVRFLEPLASDYRSTTISIKRRTDSGYGQSQTISKGSLNEVTFYNLESNQQYQVRITTKSNSGKESNGIVLGGDTGTSLLPLSSVTDAVVTPGLNRLTVSWLDPANSVPTAVQVEVQRAGSNRWSEPLIVLPKTQQAVFHGLQANVSYKVRITAVVNNIGSAGIVLDNTYQPRATSLVASVPKIAQNSTASQTLSLLGTNTRFSAGNTTLRMYAPNGTEMSSYLSGFSVYSQTRADVTVKQSLTPGIYKLVLRSKDDGILTTSIEIVASTSGPTLVSMSDPSLNNGYTAASVTLTGTGFAANSLVIIDSTPVSQVRYTDSQRLSFTLPAGLQPGLHKITVATGDRSSAPLAFVVHPFRTSGTLTTPNMRNGAYRAELQVSNLDINQRRAKVIVVVRRNNQFMETKEFDQSFNGYENKTLKFDFGGTNTPYADGPTDNVSLQVFVIDSYQSSPVAEPVLIFKDLNL